MKDTDIVIQDVWKVEQEIFDVFHKICVKYNLRYSLVYGTLLGAVRHKGFIPWDDDIDVMMPREDYEKLLSIWPKVAPPNYLIQDFHTDKDYTNNFAKVRKNNTTFLQFESEKEKKYHKGIFIDIFPVDRVASGKITSKIQYIACAVNLLFSRGYRSGTPELIGKIEKILLCLPKNQYFLYRKWSEKVIRAWNKKGTNKYLIACTIGDCKRYYPANLFDKLDTIEFNEKEYFVTHEYKKFLEVRYGNYMQLPPEEDRVWKHHPILVDYQYNYEELVK